MTTNVSFRDVERLSAYLDGELRPADRARLETRLESDAELRSLLDELRQAQTLLRRTVHRRAPRSFLLTPKMAGIRAPIPRAVPALSWASVVATLILFVTFAGNLIPLVASAPKMAPLGMGGGYGGGGAPEVDDAQLTSAPAAISETATPEMYTMLAPEPTLAGESPAVAPDTRVGEPQAIPDEPARPEFSLSTLQIVLLVLVLVLGGAAYLVSWLTDRTFRRKLRR